MLPPTTSAVPQPLKSPQPLTEAPTEALKRIQWLLTDVDDTLTWQGTLPAQTLEALTQLKEVGVHVIAVTGACAGWCDQIAKLWPVHSVIGENGAFSMQKNRQGFHIESTLPMATMKHQQAQLLEALKELLRDYPDIDFANDQAFRYCDVAINIGQDRDAVDRDTCQELLARIRQLSIEGHKVKATQSSIHINVWIGEHSKQVTSEQLLLQQLSQESLPLEHITYIGDSLNDESMFAWLPMTFGVNNITRWLPQLRAKPSYITVNNGGYGFAELATLIVQAKQ
ncbi:HAD-IIB family hydrolase [Vibrio sp. ZSDZ65]|uniref:HAD-IIB family hydrolase n=1 Tax=Vibrio qingdaonensis TaxID=2829491 RepID=A0A9X3CK03_9VIBR|nr:HAD-IIB family hydrolase [Vibrio qingdaonensis]MCW8344848.1 HAD-IIB family hydrolase [Vibrio qingdaonensis]